MSRVVRPLARRGGLLAAVTVTVAALAACAASGSDSQAGPKTGATPTESSEAPPAEPSYLPAGDLPKPLLLEEVGARDVAAWPTADFAVAGGGGVWVSGVKPGAVRYDDASGEIAARAELPGENFPQAFATTAEEVVLPVSDSARQDPAELLRLDARTGEVLSRVELPAEPMSNATTAVDGDTSYVLLDDLELHIAVVRGDRVVDQIPARPGASAVRAGFGSLWAPAADHTVERYSFETEQWTPIAVGPNPRYLDVGFGAVWVMNQGDGSVTRIDPRSGETETIPVTGSAISYGDLTIGAGAVWMHTGEDNPRVVRIDPGSRVVTHVIDLPPGAGSVAATDELLAITDYDPGRVYLVPLPLPS